LVGGEIAESVRRRNQDEGGRKNEEGWETDKKYGKRERKES